MPETTTRPANLGRVGGSLAESLAWLNSPAAIRGEIGRLEAAVAGGDTSEATTTLLRDWQAVRRAQARLVGQDAEQLPLPGEVAAEVAGEVAG